MRGRVACMIFGRRCARPMPVCCLVLPLAMAQGERSLLLVGQIFPKDMPHFRRSLEDAD
jgi:hypothetical protein